jgi:hypothetical protein
MNFAHGRVVDAKDCDAVLESLAEQVEKTLEGPRLLAERVIAACDTLVKNLNEAVYLEAMEALGMNRAMAMAYIDSAKQMFCADSLRYRMEKELGPGHAKASSFVPPGETAEEREQILPLGVLLHIAAGNADGLPAFSVVEGLLTGNINILKLPAEEGGFSVSLLRELIRIEPALTEYIYVFDYSSKDIVHMQKLVDVADAVVIWGGDQAVSSLRAMVPANVRLIEWGHKVSFAYVTKEGMGKQTLLRGIAENIAQTSQLLCSSVQGIYVDTQNMAIVHDFCEEFLPVLDDVLETQPLNMGPGIRSQRAYALRNAALETLYDGSVIYRGKYGSLQAFSDTVLEPSIQFGNAWVRPLPKERITAVLRPYKSFLQTVGLACGEAERPRLEESFLRTGVVRVCPPGRMSFSYAGAPHDGEYPLRRYTKIASTSG